MKKFLLPLMLFCTQFVFAQIQQGIVDRVKTYSKVYEDYKALANQIKTDFKSEEDRAAAIFTWIALNIQYDVESFYSKHPKTISYSYSSEAERRQIEKQIHEMLAIQTIQEGKGVCQGYSELYRLLCQACGIPCVVISGYSRTGLNDIGKTRPVADHAWNAIQLNNEWLFVDATWGAGHVDHQKKQFVAAFTPVYFAAKPKVFAYNHFPEEAKWNFTSLTLKTFADQPLVYHSFFGIGFELVAPREGVIKKIRKGRIKIELKGENGKSHSFHYAFRDMKYMKPAEVSVSGNKISVLIDPENRRRAYLDIIIDGETAISYQMKL